MTFPPNATALYRDKAVTVSCYTPEGVQIEKDGELLTVMEAELTPLSVPAPLPNLAVPVRQPLAILIANNAGGVAKTSLAVALAHLFASWGLRVALLDLDPQANATTFSGILRPIEAAETFHALLTPDAVLPDFIRVHGYDLLPASPVLRQTARDIVKGDRHSALLTHMPALRERYDLILMDCGPSLDALATAGGLTADFVMTPSSTSVKGIDGFQGAAGFVEELRQLGNPDIRTCLFVPTLHRKNTKAEREAYADMVAGIPAELLATPILRGQKWVDAARAGQPVTAFAPKSTEAQQAERLARELLRAIGWDDEGTA
ncbi:ParA family protein [Deinococcus wulumuqiensis]|uniref:Chromosome partitioning protein ParA n=1 Tax=Deinococcus wulumuqiensis TaxID=980427 RepID=A0AAV4K494_9DEIO|nr:ParA family protein [Deinococcus wulumuqiensis]QII20160.1 ParA family protein [Deinococcus wulumuqiensis R12]GGI75594.1 chromosome partitioning protein ParA [Deinococcus wulumuqiensis]GGP28743.1 chromosome partitioning protein ParA [Deinococcus wulumuqiensis]